MTKFTATVIAILMLLAVFSSAVMADNNTTVISGNGTATAPVTNTVTGTVEIRGPVYNGTDLPSIIATQGTNGAITMNADKFAAFFYDVNNNITTETLSIQNIAGTSSRTIGVNGLIYSTTIAQTAYKYKDSGWGTYNVLGWFADKYIPLVSTDASKLARLAIDDDTKRSLTAGSKLDMGNGYTLAVKQVDVNGEKVLMELDYNGVYVDDAVIDTANGDHTWNCKLDKILGTDNVTVMKVHVSSVFQGAVDSMAQIDGLWLLDFENPIQINSDASYGKLDSVSLNGATISIKNKNSFTLSRDSAVEIGNGLYFKVADADALRFYAYKQETTPNAYDIRGTVATGAANWDASNFAGFFYDLKKDVSTESMKVLAVNGRTIPENDLVYSTTIKNIDYQYTKDADSTTLSAWGSYPVIGFMAQEYVPLSVNDASKMAKLILDSDDKYTLKTGDKLDLGKGYSLAVKQVDIDGKKVWMELDYNGQRVDDSIITTDTGDHTWQCKISKVLDANDVYVMRVHVSQVFQGAEQSVAQIDGLWLIDFENAFKINSDATYGKLDNVALNGPTITIYNKNSFSLTSDTDKLDINGQGMYFKVADDDNNLRYYPYVEQTIGNGSVVVSTPATGTITPVVNVTTTPVPTNVTPNETIVPTPIVNETPVVTPVVTSTPVAVNNTTTPPSTPGFGAIPAIVGLLVIVYLVRKNRQS